MLAGTLIIESVSFLLYFISNILYFMTCIRGIIFLLANINHFARSSWLMLVPFLTRVCNTHACFTCILLFNRNLSKTLFLCSVHQVCYANDLWLSTNCCVEKMSGNFVLIHITRCDTSSHFFVILNVSFVQSFSW